MGGFGSGRRRDCRAKRTTDDYVPLDIRAFKRRGLLTPGTNNSLPLSTGAFLQFRAEVGHLILSYWDKDESGDWKEQSYHFPLTTTLCHMGGERHWFLCPAPGCGRRVAVVYGGKTFACRICYQLAYPSQRENVAERAAMRAQRIRNRMGWSGGVLTGSGWEKPKGMHWRTYERLNDKHRDFEAVVRHFLIARDERYLKQTDP